MSLHLITERKPPIHQWRGFCYEIDQYLQYFVTKSKSTHRLQLTQKSLEFLYQVNRQRVYILSMAGNHFLIVITRVLLRDWLVYKHFIVNNILFYISNTVYYNITRSKCSAIHTAYDWHNKRYTTHSGLVKKQRGSFLILYVKEAVLVLHQIHYKKGGHDANIYIPNTKM